MTGFLLDTSVISAFSPDRAPPNAEVRAWFSGQAVNLHLSTMSFAEVEQGASKLARAGAVGRADRIRRWLDEVTRRFASRIIGVDAALARAIGAMADDAIAHGRHPGFVDIAIAATAKEARLTLLTRNVKHFVPLGIGVVDPFERLP